jgi:hypothetical protein
VAISNQQPPPALRQLLGLGGAKYGPQAVYAQRCADVQRIAIELAQANLQPAQTLLVLLDLRLSLARPVCRHIQTGARSCDQCC